MLVLVLVLAATTAIASSAESVPGGVGVAASSSSSGSAQFGSPKWRPVVLMHGLMASAEAMSHAQKWIQDDFPGIYTLNCEVGNGKSDSLSMPMDTQVEKLAACIQSDATLRAAGSFNLIGHSQGGLLTRGYVERFNDPPVYNLLSWAGPQGGQYGVPDVNALCPDDVPGCGLLADIFDWVLNGAWTENFVQKSLSFATYWRDPFNLAGYREYSQFLADVNNARDAKNATYKTNIQKLNGYLLVYSTVDEIVIPRSSPWFQHYADGQDSTVVSFRDTPLYKEDWLGLRALDLKNQLFMEAIPCPHQDIPRDVCKQWYDKYSRALLNNTL